jgi:hypothetical protein
VPQVFLNEKFGLTAPALQRFSDCYCQGFVHKVTSFLHSLPMKRILLLAAIAALQSCDPGKPGHYEDRTGKFLSEVVALEEFNSEYDDYNSALPANRYGEAHLIFSSKRDRKDVFNLVYFPVSLTYDDHLQLVKSRGFNLDYISHFSGTAALAREANGNFNVYGPKVLSFRYDIPSYSDNQDLALFYADDSEGNMEIKYTYQSQNAIKGPFKFDLLNSPKDDGYPSFSRGGEKIYFSSNRDGNFDIYELSIVKPANEPTTIESLVNPKTSLLRKVEELSTPYDDKCPYFEGNMMVFVSDRPGGKGGQDIYYAQLQPDGKFSAPVNAGDRINTEHNEYRPIIPALNDFTYPLMFFSSDRPGGKGGFDLYMTGLMEKWK